MIALVAALPVGVALIVSGVLRAAGDDVAIPEAPIESSAATSQPPASQSPPPVLQKPGDFPKDGPASFVMGKTTGAVSGIAGNLRRFRVAVESNVAGELEEFTQVIDQTLADPRSWIGGKRHRFQRVGDGMPYNFTVYLVTRQTAYEMCRVNGVDIRENGVPYTSCRQVRKVIINLDRWRLSVPEFVDGGVPLRIYREYVINHEVGHELGHGHEICPAPGKPAPTMVRQTLGLEGCTANPWPYLDGERYAGPPIR